MEYCVLNVDSSFDLHVHTCRIFFSKLQKIRISKCSCFKTSEQLMNISVIFTYSSCLLACHLFKVLDACNSHQQIKTPYLKKNIKLYTFSVSIMHVHVFIFNNMIFFYLSIHISGFQTLSLKKCITILDSQSCDNRKKKY